MEAIAGAGVIVTIIGIVLAIMIAIAPLMIWSKTSQMVTLLRETNLYLKHIATVSTPPPPPPGQYYPPRT
jgi:hypothetical protein